MPKHMIAVERVASVPADLSPYTDGWPLWDEVAKRLYVVDATGAAAEEVQAHEVELNSVTAAATVADDGRPTVVLADATAAAFTVTLPTPTSGRMVTVKKVDASANAVTVGPAAAETIDGAASATLAAQWDVATFVSDGTNWFVI